MDGANVMTFTLSSIPKAVYSYLKKTGSELKDYEYVIFHQANKFILDKLYKKLGISEKGIIYLENCGNTVSSSIPLAMEKFTKKNNKNEVNILLVGFGVGLSWGITSVKL